MNPTVYSAAQMRELDRLTLEREPVSNLDLMERAATAWGEWFNRSNETVDEETPIVLLCGPGNNGGDGYVIARYLLDRGFNVRVFATAAKSASCRTNRHRWTEKRGSETYPLSNLAAADLPNAHVIDALLGSGLDRPVTADSDIGRAIELVNASDATVHAVDLPSGLFADRFTDGLHLRAQKTGTFQTPKLACFLDAAPGDWRVLDIGLDARAQRETESPYSYLTDHALRPRLRTRGKFDHKGTFGHALVIAGSHGKIGAALLCGRAVLRAGAGLLTMQVPECGYAIVQSSFPEAMVVTDRHRSCFSEVPEDLSPYRAIAVGPGLGTNAVTARAFRDLLEMTDRPLVLDADALNLLAKNPNWLQLVPPHSILTPHPKEFSRLFGETAHPFARLERLRERAQEHALNIVLKGGHTAIAAPDGTVAFNTTGNPGMGTGGTGDVLTGILTGLLAQGYAPTDAAQLGVFLHGRAGDLAKQELGHEALLAQDVINYLGSAFGSLRSSFPTHLRKPGEHRYRSSR